MKRLVVIVTGVFLWTAPIMAETYSWVDDAGTYNFTEDYSRIPQKYRNKLEKRGDMGSTPEVKESAAPSATSKTPALAETKSQEKPASGTATGSFGGKSYDQWKQELFDREAAMNSLKTRATAIEEELKRNSAGPERSKKLVDEHNALIGQFSELRKQYEQQVELARKAGLKIDITP